MESNAKIQISFIRDDPGLVVRGDTADEVDTLIASILPIYKKFRDAVDKGKVNQANVKAEAAGLSAVCKTCQAQMVLKKGVSKIGKPWSGLFCPNADRNDKTSHLPVWL